MAEFGQKVLDVRTWKPIEGLEAQSCVFCNTRTTNLEYINNDLRAAEVREILTNSAARRHFSRATSWVEP